MLSALVSVAAMLMGARIASADEVWVQSYERTSQTQACVAQPGETPWQASWGTDSSWKPSWEQWANDGRGGWTCTRSITWARDSPPFISCATGGTYVVGDIGPGCGLVFLISGGLTYEMAPNTWGVNDSIGIQWCSDLSNSVATGTAVGTGSANTTAMLTNDPVPGFVACTSSAPNAVRAYAGGGLTDWFLPSQDELNAMCNYSRTWVGSPLAPPTGVCTGAQNSAFAGGTFGFASDYYWSSSQEDASSAFSQAFNSGFKFNGTKEDQLVVRPIRAF